jgi:hypothetical protein
MKKLSVYALVAALACLSSTVSAQDFPEPNSAPSAADLKSLVSGQVFTVAVTDGTTWRWQFNGNGYYYINISNGFSDTGEWRVEDGKLCTKGKRIPASCNDVRLSGEKLLLKRDNGEIVHLVVKK